MEDVVYEAEREEVKVKEESEVLPDGTVHSTQRVLHHKVRHVRRSNKDDDGGMYEADEEVPGSSKEEVFEMFEQPPKLVQKSEDIEEVLDDGTKVKKHVVMNRMVHLIKMHHESFDEEHGKTEEDYEIEEVIPNTESAFVTSLDSDSDAEQEEPGPGAQSADSAELQQDPSEDKPDIKLVSCQYGSDVDGPYTKGQTPLQVVEDMLAKGQLTVDDFEGIVSDSMA